MKRAALYIRVSTEEQARHGYSLAAQLDALHKFCADNSYTIIGEFADEGISARKPYKKRPALMQLLHEVEADRVDVILFVKLDRWFRNVAAYYQVQPILEAHGVAWRAILEDHETETASGRFVVNIMLSTHENEADRTSERIRSVNSYRKAQGYVISGSVPFGVRIVDHRFSVNPDEAPIVQDLFRWFLENRTKRGLCIYCTEQHGRPLSNHGAVYLLTNPHYVDLGIISQNDFDRAGEILRSRSFRRPRTGGIHLFSGFISCSECGASMKAIAKTDRYYYCCARRSAYGSTSCNHKKCIKEDALENFLLEHIVEHAKIQNAEIRRKKKKPAVDAAGIRRKIDRLKTLYINDLIELDEYQRDYHEYERLLAAAEASKPESEIDIPSLESALKLYSALTPENRRAFWSRTIERINVDADNNIAVRFYS